MSNMKSISVKPVFEYSTTYQIMKASMETGKKNYEFRRISVPECKEETVNSKFAFTKKRTIR